jgi:hypothetical protein
LTYDNLASGLKLALEKDKTALDADRLKNYTGIASATPYSLFSLSVAVTLLSAVETIISRGFC